MANLDIKAYMRANFVPQWRLAKEMDISEMTLLRRLREELPPDEKQKIICLIDQIAQAREE